LGSDDKTGRGPLAWLAYITLRIIAFFLGVIPYSWAQGIGSTMGRVLAFFDRSHIRRATRHITESLHLDEKSARKIAVRVYCHTGMVAAEFFQLARMKNPDEFRPYAVLDSAAEFRRYFDAGKGVVVPIGHIGNWEYCGQMIAVEGMPPGSIIKHFKNGYIDSWVDKIRRKWDLVPVEKSTRGVVEAVRRVRDGKVMGIMSDQHADEGIDTVFFGKPVKTVDTAARIALKSDAPMVPVTSYRRDDGKHVLVIWPQIDRPEGVDDETEAARLMTQRMNDIFEEAIREHPEQWLWQQRRWR